MSEFKIDDICILQNFCNTTDMNGRSCKIVGALKQRFFASEGLEVVSYSLILDGKIFNAAPKHLRAITDIELLAYCETDNLISRIKEKIRVQP